MRKKLLELLSDSFVYGLSSLVSQIASFLLLPLYTSHLTPTDYGVLAMLNIVTMGFSPLATLGMTNGAFRRLSLKRDEAGRSAVLMTVATGVATLTCLCLIVGVALARYPAIWIVGDERATSLVQLTLIGAALTMVGDPARIELRTRRRTRTIGSINLVAVLLTIFVTIGCVVFGRMGVRGVVFGNLAGCLFSTATAFLLTHRRFAGSIRLDELKAMLRYGVPLVPHRFISMGLLMYSQYYVREAMGLAEAGLFDMAAKFAMPLGLVVNAVQEAWIPYKFQIHAQDERPHEFFRQAFTYYVALMGFLWVGTTAWGPEALRLMTHENFAAAATLVPLTALSRVMNGIYFMAGTGIELSDDTRPYSLISGVGLLVLVVSTSLAVPRFGAAGAAACSSVATLVMTAMSRRLARSRYLIHYDWPRIAGLAATAVACCIVWYALSDAEPRLRVLTAVGLSIAYPAVAAVLLFRLPDRRSLEAKMSFETTACPTTSTTTAKS